MIGLSVCTGVRLICAILKYSFKMIEIDIIIRNGCKTLKIWDIKNESIAI